MRDRPTGPKRRPVRAIAVGVAVLVAVPVVAAVAAGPERVEQAAVAAQRAEPISPLATDLVTVYNSGELKESTATAALAAAQQAGASAAVGRSASIGMTALWRGSTVVQQPPAGFRYPMGTTVLPPDLIGSIMGREVSGVLTADAIVMSARTAALRSAQAGDRIVLTASNGADVSYTIAAVVDDAITGGTELLMTPAAADRLDLQRLSRVVIWGFESRAAIDAALAANDLVSTKIRIRRSWDPFDPDFTIGMARTKEALGEFAYRVNANGSVSVDSAWYSQYITQGSVGQLRLQTGCNAAVRPALEAAMAEVIASGLEYTINYAHANTAGGCYFPRFNRLTPSSSIGFLSRHSWGQAIDTNTVGSCQGCAPPDLDCRTVRIFRKHGFAWGGNFLTPDGMHFEWVGERRDQYPYPSRFCPNLVQSAYDPDGSPDASTQLDTTVRPRIFEEDGMIEMGEHGH